MAENYSIYYMKYAFISKLYLKFNTILILNCMYENQPNIHCILMFWSRVALYHISTHSLSLDIYNNKHPGVAMCVAAETLICSYTFCIYVYIVMYISTNTTFWFGKNVLWECHAHKLKGQYEHIHNESVGLRRDQLYYMPLIGSM